MDAFHFKKPALPAKILLAAFVLALIFLLMFLFLGENLEPFFSAERFADILRKHRAFGWAMGILLLISDLLLPIPATGIMAAFGAVYGFWGGWLGSALGSMLASLLGYGLVRIGGDRCAKWLAKPAELVEFRQLFQRWGGLAIIVSRAFPILPEVMAVLAGLAQMPLPLFLAASAAGILPVTALYAWMGTVQSSLPQGVVFLIAVILPVLLWIVCMPLGKKMFKKQPPSS